MGYVFGQIDLLKIEASREAFEFGAVGRARPEQAVYFALELDVESVFIRR